MTKLLKKAKEVKVGDIIEIRYFRKKWKFKILQIPITKSAQNQKSKSMYKGLINV